MLKYQIFVSSTYDDLKDERAQVIKAILEMGHIPVGMEMFSAADEEQWKIIARQIDETDYYVLIAGHRYGSVTGGVSYTEKEYDYAISKNIPVLGFIVDSSVEPLAKNTEKEDEKIAALLAFKNKVKQRPVGFWKSADDLHGKVSIALMKAFNTTPRVGWSRSNTISGPEVTQELSRLSKENAELRLQLEVAHNQEAIDRKSHLQQRIRTLKAIPKMLYLRERGKSDWDIEVETTLFKVFSQLAPEMMIEISTSGASTYLALMNKPDSNMEMSTKAPLAINHMKLFFADLASFDLVEPSKKKHAVSDNESYWSLTNEGTELLKLDRVTRLEIAAAQAIKIEETALTSEPSVKPVAKKSTRKTA
ncbi:DUF4062 domain-containing protein [uncultured Oxalicibacterium sp.]|uniref:DUF4062 domain-containing protein n=1 Tax=uncultured Oxalicibacterium sp. TaxID=1168540 RepID=UPI0025D37F78|nr:DUF4062 domain-containing protein [uncultured Oxalicibacterium sp.]